MDSVLQQALRDGEQLGARYALQIPQVTASGWTGARTGRRSGSSIDFQDYREYQPGDDLRFIDWGIYARSDRLNVKLFREEVTPHLDLILDGSRSMNLENTAKAAAAAKLAALLATSAANSQCTQAVWLSGEGFLRLPNDTLPPSAWDKLTMESRRTPQQAFEILPPKLRRLGMRVFVSDLLWPGNPLTMLRRLRDGAAALFVIQLLAREDALPPEHGNLRVTDSETGEEAEMYIDSAVAQRYAENLAQWQQSWSDACRQCGAEMVTLIAEDLADSLTELQSIHLLAPGMIPLLTYPLALVALTTLPALAAIYILRNRFRRRTVSSLLLWQFQVQSKSAGAKVHRLQLPLLFFLELLALALLVGAAAGPVWKLPQSARPLIVVLDDSFSMQAISGGASSQSRAEEFLNNLVRSRPATSTRFILAGTRASSLGSPVQSVSQMTALLRGWHCWSPDATIDSAITLAAELGRNEANILILTDRKPPSDKFSNNRIEWRAFGEPVDNVAIVNATRTTFGDQDRCMLEVANFSDEAHTVRLAVQAGANTIQSSLLSLIARQIQRVVFNIPASSPVLRADLDTGGSYADALALDNEVQLLPPVRKRVRVEVVLSDENLRTLANRTLDATGLRATISADPEIIIHENDAPVSANCWGLRWTGSSDKNAYIGPFVVDTSHPLAEGVGLDGVVWAGAAATSVAGDVPVILAGNTPLLSVRQDVHGGRLLTLNFNPELSTLQNTPDWPVIFWNLLQWRASESPGLKETNTRLGAQVVLKTTDEAVTVTQPDGTTHLFPKTGGELALETPMPGVYSVKMGTATDQFAVNPLSADESDLSVCASGQWGTWGETTELRLEESSAVWIVGLLALGLLSAHLFLLTSGTGGGR